MRVYTGTFVNTVRQLLGDFLTVAEPVDVGQWQSTDIKGDRSKVTWELREASLVIEMPATMSQAQAMISPNLPWAEDHFQERICGEPLNPPPSEAWWPFAQNGNAAHRLGGKFSHTYPERFWPKFAGNTMNGEPHGGIRFDYGDYDDVLNRLSKNPLTRQAYLPIWFPEDTGAPDGERVPCTLGYLFMIRNGKLHITYHIRSCDFMRHWRDDVYMAIRLAQVTNEMLNLPMLEMGDLTMHIGSFHIFDGDRAMVKYLAHQANLEYNRSLMKGLR